MQFEQVMTRNTKTNWVVLSSDPKGTVTIEWKGAGDPTGGDYQIAPDEIRRLPQYAKLISQGIIVEVQAAEIAAQDVALAAQRAAFEQRLNGAASASQATVVNEDGTTTVVPIVPEAQNDSLVFKCVGPNCDNEIAVKEAKKNERPPLCSTHASLEPQYVPEDVLEGSKTVRKWNRFTMGAPERAV